MARAAVYGFRGGQPTPADAAAELVAADQGGCAQQAGLALAAGGGELRFAPGVDAGVTPLIRAIGERIAGLYGQPLVVTSARRPGAITVNGNVSDHASGNALDFGMAANGGTNDGPVGDRIAAAASSSPAGPSPARSPGRATAASSTSSSPASASSSSGRPTKAATTTTTSTSACASSHDHALRSRARCEDAAAPRHLTIHHHSGGASWPPTSIASC